MRQNTAWHVLSGHGQAQASLLRRNAAVPRDSPLSQPGFPSSACRRASCSTSGQAVGAGYSWLHSQDQKRIMLAALQRGGGSVVLAGVGRRGTSPHPSDYQQVKLEGPQGTAAGLCSCCLPAGQGTRCDCAVGHSPSGLCSSQTLEIPMRSGSCVCAPTGQVSWFKQCP